MRQVALITLTLLVLASPARAEKNDFTEDAEQAISNLVSLRYHAVGCHRENVADELEGRFFKVVLPRVANPENAVKLLADEKRRFGFENSYSLEEMRQSCDMANFNAALSRVGRLIERLEQFGR